jgi:elongation factor P
LGRFCDTALEGIIKFLFLEQQMRASEMRKGQTVKIDGKLYAIVDYQHVKLGKGGAVYQTKLKSLVDGTIQNVRLRSEETVEEAFLDKRTYEYLYSSGSEHVLMDTKTYDQISLDDDAFGDGPKFLKANAQLQVSMYQGRPLIVELPNTVDLEVTDTPPEIKGATATNQSKPATLETGFVVSVPPFIKVGDIVRVDTRTGEYVTRAKDR